MACISLIDEKASLLIKCHSGVFNVSVSKIKCSRALSKPLEIISLPPYAMWHEGVQRSPTSNIPNTLSELSFSIFFPSLFSLITFYVNGLVFLSHSVLIKDIDNYRSILIPCLMYAKFVRKKLFLKDKYYLPNINTKRELFAIFTSIVHIKKS